jgi:hypothetical protein
VRLAFLPGWRAVVEPEEVGTVLTELERRLNRRAGDHGGLDLDIPMACVNGCSLTREPRVGRARPSAARLAGVRSAGGTGAGAALQSGEGRATTMVVTRSDDQPSSCGRRPIILHPRRTS